MKIYKEKVGLKRETQLRRLAGSGKISFRRCHCARPWGEKRIFHSRVKRDLLLSFYTWGWRCRGLWNLPEVTQWERDLRGGSPSLIFSSLLCRWPVNFSPVHSSLAFHWEPFEGFKLTVSWQVSLGEASLKFILINFLKSQILSVFTRKTSNWHLGVVEMHFGQLFEDSNFKCIYQKNYHGNLILTFGGDGQWIYFITALRKRLFYLYAS